MNYMIFFIIHSNHHSNNMNLPIRTAYRQALVCYTWSVITISYCCSAAFLLLNSEIEFINYTDTFREYGDKVLLKIHHSLRVENLCRDIAEKTGLSSSSIDLSGKCGLLHDIGRFEQWRKYGTYNDSKSTDHGDLGASILKNNSLISKFTAEDQETIINTAKYHNKYSVPFDLNERNGLFVHMTRDADKLDIFYLSSLNELHVNTHDSKISEKAYDLIMNNQNILSFYLKKLSYASVFRLWS